MLVFTFEWEQDIIDYVRGKKPYPNSKDSIKAKRILAVMNLHVKHFVALEILLEDGMMKVYDCNLRVYEDSNFFTKIQPLLDLLPRLMKQSDPMNHFPTKVLNVKWTFKGCNKDKDLEKNLTSFGSYVLAYIKYLLNRIKMAKPRALLNETLWQGCKRSRLLGY